MRLNLPGNLLSHSFIEKQNYFSYIGIRHSEVKALNLNIINTPEKTFLPDYESPPVIEVVCGIQINPLEKYQATVFGLFRQAISDEYTYVQEMPPLYRVMGHFGSFKMD